MIIQKFLNLGNKNLTPYTSFKTMDFHFNKHYVGYVNKTNNLIKNTKYENMDLIDIIQISYLENNMPIFNNASQIFNHEFFWNSLDNGIKPSTNLKHRISLSFGSLNNFLDQIKESANRLFGNGWVWVYLDNQNSIRIRECSNACSPLTANYKPILTLDLWEHAYYLDYQNLKTDYIDNFIHHLINWNFMEENLLQ